MTNQDSKSLHDLYFEEYCTTNLNEYIQELRRERFPIIKRAKPHIEWNRS
jgi:hypothetical protein